jgi:hypothetical protein
MKKATLLACLVLAFLLGRYHGQSLVDWLKRTTTPKQQQQQQAEAPVLTLAKEDPEAEGYRLVTDGTNFKIQFHWSSGYWGPLLWDETYGTQVEAERNLALVRKEARKLKAEKRRQWTPVHPNTP